MMANGYLKQYNPKKKLVDKAVEVFGTTTNCKEAGYILEDGRMLDFSGKKQGGEAGSRNLDHREIVEAYDLPSAGLSGDDAMDYFTKSTNSIRFSTHGFWSKGHDVNVQLDTVNKPTLAQRQRIVQCCRLYKADVAYDIYDEKGRRETSDYFEKPNCVTAVDKVLKALTSARSRD